MPHHAEPAWAHLTGTFESEDELREVIDSPVGWLPGVSQLGSAYEIVDDLHRGDWRGAISDGISADLNFTPEEQILLGMRNMSSDQAPPADGDAVQNAVGHYAE